MEPLTVQRRILGLVALLAVLLFVVPVSSARLLEPMVLGWERIFKLDWEATPDPRATVRGYLVNDSPYTINRVQLLVEGLDTSGNIVWQRVSWVPGALSPFSRAYFIEPAPEPAAAYRVRVFAYDRIEAPSWP
jgi:hypothetical protein